jgi:hypothetical protein
LPDEQIAILVMLATAKNRGTASVAEKAAPAVCGLKPAVFEYHVDALSEADLIYIGHYGYGRQYEITAKGAGWFDQAQYDAGVISSVFASVSLTFITSRFG